jgi:hypothetical protein
VYGFDAPDRNTCLELAVQLGIQKGWTAPEVIAVIDDQDVTVEYRDRLRLAIRDKEELILLAIDGCQKKGG